MIDKNEIFDEVKDNTGLWCATDCVGADLAAAAGVAITNKLRAVSVSSDAIAEIWPWVENTNIKIIARFMVEQDIDVDFMSNLSSKISSAFREGANGAIVFVHMRNMEHFITELKYIRDDLFFNKSLSIGLDINEIGHDDWESVFKMLQSVRADSLTLFLSNDDGDKSDFVGRVYAMLKANMADWHGTLSFIAGDNVVDRIDQFYRLAQLLRFDASQTMLFWVNKE